MSVYYIRAPEAGLVKIGFAEQPWRRLSKMQVDSPTRLMLVAFEEGGRPLESARHRQFEEFRRRGEWFEHAGALAAHIAALPPAQEPLRSGKIGGPLGDWIKANGHTLTSFADLVGSSQAALSRVCAGKQFPRRELMVRIMQATNGVVDANALIGIEPQSRTARQVAA